MKKTGVKKSFLLCSLFFVIFLNSACSLFKTRSEIPASPHGEGAAKVGVTAPPLATPVSPTATSVPTPLAPGMIAAPKGPGYKVAIVLSPAGMRAFAQMGALKAFQKYQIIAQQVVGYEWGAVVGALYATNGKAYDVEWKLSKLRDSDLSSGLLRSSSESPGKLQRFFEDIYGSQQIEQSRITFSCPVLSAKTLRYEWISSGRSADMMRKCISLPPLYNTEQDWSSDGVDIVNVMSQLRAKGYQVIILFNALGRSAVMRENESDSGRVLWARMQNNWLQANKMADWVVDLELNQFGYMDYSARREMQKAGEIIGEKMAKMIAEKYGF